MTSPRAASFFAGLWAGTAPMVVWALHFAISYVMVAVVCASAVQSGTGEPDALRWWLVAGTALALVVLAAMLWRACTSISQAPFLPVVRGTCTTLALIGVIWTGVPLAMLPACAA